MKDVLTYLEHISDAVRVIERAVSGTSQSAFQKDQILAGGIIYQLIIIGEAVGHIPPDIRQEYPETPWSSIAGLRNKLVHAYFQRDTQLVWAICIQDLPPLKRTVKKIIDTVKQGR